MQKLHKYHVRYVSELAPGFAPLGQENEISLLSSGRILTFQGHPEMTFDISQGLMKGDDGTYKPAPASASDVILHDISSPHEGRELWRSIMRWAARDE